LQNNSKELANYCTKVMIEKISRLKIIKTELDKMRLNDLVCNIEMYKEHDL
jgi:hypothetical protein